VFDGETVGDAVFDGETVCVAVFDGETVGDTVFDGEIVRVNDGETVGDVVFDGETVRVNDWVGLTVGDTVVDVVSEAVDVGDAVAAVPDSVKSPNRNWPVYVTAAPKPTQKLLCPSPPTGITCALSGAAAVGTERGDDARAVHGPAGPEVEYAIVAVAGPETVLQKEVELIVSAV
jgi:hypothetical protein